MNVDLTLSKDEAAEGFAKAWNLLDVTLLEPFLDERTVYESQMVLTAMTGKTEILAYLQGKFRTLSSSPAYRPFFEIGRLPGYGTCVVMCQGSKESPVALALFKVDGRWIKRIDLCIVPPPHQAHRTGIYPGIE